MLHNCIDWACYSVKSMKQNESISMLLQSHIFFNKTPHVFMM